MRTEFGGKRGEDGVEVGEAEGLAFEEGVDLSCCWSCFLIGGSGSNWGGGHDYSVM